MAQEENNSDSDEETQNIQDASEYADSFAATNMDNIEEIPISMNSNPRKKILLGTLLALAAFGTYYLFSNAGISSGFFASIIGGDDSAISAIGNEAPLDITPPPDMAKSSEFPDDPSVADDSDNSDEEEGEIIEEPLPVVGIKGEHTTERAWEALETMQNWRTDLDGDPVIIKEYLLHKKVWVRLAAFEIAIDRAQLSILEQLSVGKTLSENFRHDQMKRYLKRVRARNQETYVTMSNLIFNREAIKAAPEDGAVLRQAAEGDNSDDSVVEDDDNG